MEFCYFERPDPISFLLNSSKECIKRIDLYMNMNDNCFYLYLYYMQRILSLCITASLIMPAGISCAEALSAEQQLGSLLFQDKNLSLKRNQSCASCHALNPVKVKKSRTSAAGFVDPDNAVNGTAVSRGSIEGAAGSLNAPSIGYAAFSPDFHFDEDEGLFVGGQFWNGRANNLIEQAKQPFLNPVEMAMPTASAVIERMRENEHYAAAFREVYDIDLHDAELTGTPEGIEQVYTRLAEAIAAFEKARVFNKFNAKFDYFLAGKTKLKPIELKGFNLFNGKAQCSACHVSEATTAPDGKVVPPLFTDFTYDNIGLPRNVNIPGNPEPNLGLGGRADIAALDPNGNELGKHKVMSLRNIAITPPYGHNGVFKNLKQIVHFYNTRDTLGRVPDNNHAKFAKKGWPQPEVTQNVNDSELGNLELTEDEEKAIVAFLKTLTDDYPEWGHDKRVPPGTPSPYDSGEIE